MLRARNVFIFQWFCVVSIVFCIVIKFVKFYFWFLTYYCSLYVCVKWYFSFLFLIVKFWMIFKYCIACGFQKEKSYWRRKNYVCLMYSRFSSIQTALICSTSGKHILRFTIPNFKTHNFDRRFLLSNESRYFKLKLPIDLFGTKWPNIKRFLL